MDEHFYRNMEEMMAQAFRYDTYSRTNPTKIFCGEWATRVGSPTPNMSGALGDGAWMTCMERNSDIVLLSCYAPLFVNVSQLTGNGPLDAVELGPDWLRRADELRLALVLCPDDVQHHARRRDSRDRFAEHPDARMAAAGARGGAPPPAQQTPRGLLLRHPRQQERRDLPEGREHLRLRAAHQDSNQRRAEDQPEGEAVALAGSSLDDTNSITAPNKVVPRTEKVAGLSADFTREFPAYSVTVLKLQSI